MHKLLNPPVHKITQSCCTRLLNPAAQDYSISLCTDYSILLHKRLLNLACTNYSIHLSGCAQDYSIFYQCIHMLKVNWKPFIYLGYVMILRWWKAKLPSEMTLPALDHLVFEVVSTCTLETSIGAGLHSWSKHFTWKTLDLTLLFALIHLPITTWILSKRYRATPSLICSWSIHFTSYFRSTEVILLQFRSSIHL